jgi:hypothetical protein
MPNLESDRSPPSFPSSLARTELQISPSRYHWQHDEFATPISRRCVAILAFACKSFSSKYPYIHYQSSANPSFPQTSAASVFNTVACYTSPTIGRRTYQGPASAAEATALSARLFGTWTLLASVVRTYAAYNIDNKGIYAVALSTYALALAHFTSEWLLYKTMSFAKGLAAPLAVATLTTVWMVAQLGHYTTG